MVETRSEEWVDSEEDSDTSHEEMQMTSSPHSSEVKIRLQTSSMTTMDLVDVDRILSQTSGTVRIIDMPDKDNNNSNSNNSSNINSNSLVANRGNKDETHSVVVSEGEVLITSSMMTLEVGLEASAVTEWEASEECSVEVK